MRRRARKFWHFVVTRNAIIVAIGLAVGGLILLRASLALPDELLVTKELVKELATTLFGLGVIAFAWELFARRSFMREVLDSVNLAEQVDDAGVQVIARNYNLDIPWGELFDSAMTLDLFVSYARTWRNNNRTNLERLLRRAGARLRVVLPDPADDGVMTELARRFDSTVEDVRGRIVEAVKDYADLRRAVATPASVECWYARACPLSAIYLFGNSGVVSFHSHQRKRVDVPTFMVQSGKPLYAFFRAEFDSLLASARRAEGFEGDPAPVPTEKTDDQSRAAAHLPF